MFLTATPSELVVPPKLIAFGPTQIGAFATMDTPLSTQTRPRAGMVTVMADRVAVPNTPPAPTVPTLGRRT